ncbi:N-acetylglucosamine 6-phosphate deacetylase [Sediminihabitans luteus]|uniref:N-acetylglucosamine 6-phosphate deacetylase n=1 Tax=Sediminihabitans luteus TaxID=1138585 RepID=A0A2M9CDV1_9CELL|nr:amidohydrolase family protein [Sediminihabitans luteus]PJJ70073.1 N-acetylglucosamine 6-phosphate deacetylase [Sediminihabitans luteus]GIJ00143.1 N-acetylglucosamine-6-phosphate deacetylase [Sediminihabitans luteus]
MTSTPAPVPSSATSPTGATSPFALRGRVVTPDSVIDDGVVVVDGSEITWVGPAADADRSGHADVVAAAVVPDEGTVLLPGLVDVHCHGGGGASFPDATTSDEARVAAREHLRHGTTSLVGSLVTADPATLLARAAVLGELVDAGDLAGIHLEGPFLSEVRCGAQNPADMLAGDPELVRAIDRAAGGHLSTMTIAPEVPGIVGDDSVIDALAGVGAVPSVGHTDASTEQTEAAIVQVLAALVASGAAARGVRPTATHLFNGMRPLHHREPGPIAACLAAAARGELAVELVSDGTHLAHGTARSVFDMVGAENVVLVTDAMAAAGMADGSYELGPMSVTVADGVARLTEGGAIAGGTYHLLDVVRETVQAGVALVDAVRSASLTPAGVLGRTDVGALEAGRRADVVVVDADLRPLSVVRAGVEVLATEA